MHKFNSPLIIQDVELAGPMTNGIVIRTVASGICHSDICGLNGAFPTTPMPMLLGHEAAGIVDRIGSGVTSISPGDHVVTSPSSFCGRCKWCIKGKPFSCVNKHQVRPDGHPPHLTVKGEELNQWVGLGGFAESMLVDENAAVKLLEALPFNRLHGSAAAGRQDSERLLTPRGQGWGAK
jgi:S-(hydroxymethyl)glutathione dehydrogenase/alcohol dehydrogenase